MASWVNISDTVIAAGRAIKAITIRQLRDNITAMAEGAAGAPRISGKAAIKALPVTANNASAQSQMEQRYIPQQPSLPVPGLPLFSFERIYGTVKVYLHLEDDFYVYLYKNGTQVFSTNSIGDNVILVTGQVGDKLTILNNAVNITVGVYVDDPVVELAPICYASELV